MSERRCDAITDVPSFEDVSAYCIDQQIEAGYIPAHERSQYLGKLATKEAPIPDVEGSGKFRNTRDAVLYQMTLEGWASQSSGDTQAPTGWFACIMNDPGDLASIRDAFGNFLDQAHFNRSDHLQQLLGNFLMREDQQGFVAVETYNTEVELKQVYDELDSAYGVWAGDES